MTDKKVTKADIIDKIYYQCPVNRKDIHKIIDLFMEEVKGALSADSGVELRGFGTFELRLRKGRDNARNPRTDEHVTVAPHYVAVFRPGKELKQAVWDAESQKK